MIKLSFNASSCVEKYGDIARAMGVNTFAFSKLEAANAAVDAVKALALKVGIPERLRELNVSEDSLESLAQSAYNDVCTPGNPRNVKFEDVLKLYKEAY